MKIQKLKESFFDETTTGMATFDDMMRLPDYFREKKHREFKIKRMSPDKYIKLAADGHEMSITDVLVGREEKLTNEYAELMKQGIKFPMIVLDYSFGVFSQEGLHRAIAAKKAGASNIPVMVVGDVE